LVNQGDHGIGRTATSQHIVVAHMLSNKVTKNLGSNKDTRIDDAWLNALPVENRLVTTILDESHQL
jgi:hypothetical protein